MYMCKCTVFMCICTLCVYMYSMDAHVFGYMCVHVCGRPEADAGNLPSLLSTFSLRQASW